MVAIGWHVKFSARMQNPSPQETRKNDATIHVLQPWCLGSLDLANRTAIAPMRQYSADNGKPGGRRMHKVAAGWVANDPKILRAAAAAVEQAVGTVGIAQDVEADAKFNGIYRLQRDLSTACLPALHLCEETISCVLTDTSARNCLVQNQKSPAEAPPPMRHPAARQLPTRPAAQQFCAPPAPC